MLECFSFPSLAHDSGAVENALEGEGIGPGGGLWRGHRGLPTPAPAQSGPRDAPALHSLPGCPGMPARRLWGGATVGDSTALLGEGSYRESACALTWCDE